MIVDYFNDFNFSYRFPIAPITVSWTYDNAVWLPDIDRIASFQVSREGMKACLRQFGYIKEALGGNKFIDSLDDCRRPISICNFEGFLILTDFSEFIAAKRYLHEGSCSII
jgi:hypothetical protein